MTLKEDDIQETEEFEFYTLEIRSTHFPPIYFNENLELTFHKDEQIAFTDGAKTFMNLDNIKNKIAENIRYRKWKRPPTKSQTFRDVKFTFEYVKADMSKFTREYIYNRNNKYKLMFQPLSRRQEIKVRKEIIDDYQNEVYQSLETAEHFKEQIKRLKKEIKEIEAFENKK